MKKIKVAIAMSGGVDSSVAAALLVEQGYDVIGIHMKLWSFLEVGGNINHESGCCSLDSIYDCRMVCGKLGIPFHTVDFSEGFYNSVIQNFKDEYIAGRTPNPCVMCNSKIKWESLINKCREFGCDFVATGHYAKLIEHSNTGRVSIQMADFIKKDQSYYLWGLSQEAMRATLFPIGHLTKPVVREIAEKYGFRTAKKPESMEICFVKDNNYRRFLEESLPELKDQLKGGSFVSEDGQKLGSHEGYPFFTIGQRKGLGGGYDEKKYVIDIQPKTNTVVLGNNDDLLADGLVCEKINLMKYAKLTEPITALVMIRYNDDGIKSTIEPLDNDHLKITFSESRRAVTPGQSTVFYDENNAVIGGGIITSAFRISHVSTPTS
jgi:tRNA-specific 2-thiouridylase